MIKPSLTILLFFLFTSTLLAQDFLGGGGLVYGTVAKNVGLNFRGEARFDKQWSITPSFNWFFNRNETLITHRWNSINIDAHYYFKIDDDWNAYPLFGINFANVSQKINGVVFSNSYVGANLGLGAEYLIDSRITGFGEVKYVVGDADQAVFTMGVLFQFSK